MLTIECIFDAGISGKHCSSAYPIDISLLIKLGKVIKSNIVVYYEYNLVCIGIYLNIAHTHKSMRQNNRKTIIFV